MDYAYKTKPFNHQHEVFKMSRDRETFALLMEQGTGKSKVIIDTAAWLYSMGNIDGVLILAPNGVHRNWVTEEIPPHLPDYIDRHCWIWQSDKANNKGYRSDFGVFVNFDGLPFLCMNYDAVLTANGKAALSKFFLARQNILMVADESTCIKTPSAKRTRAVVALGKKSAYRRILTGTPVSNGPLDLYSQFYFLDPYILGHTTFGSFKHYYADWIQQTTVQGRPYYILRNYKNLDHLRKAIEPHSYRKTKKECLDLPEQLFTKRIFSLGDEQRAMYKKMAHEFRIEYKNLQDKTRKILVPEVLARYTRLQQLTSGFLPVDPNDPDNSEVEPVVSVNPRLEALYDTLTQIEGKVIIWAKYNYDVDIICKMLRERFELGWPSCGQDKNNKREYYVQYDGRVNDKNKAEAYRLIREDKRCRVFVGKPSSGGRGLTIIVPDTVIYYSNDFYYERRVQSEDRAHRIGQTNNVLYIDLIAADTIDEKIVTALRNKQNVSDIITGDDPEKWI